MSNRKTYFLDLQTLLMYLSNQSCELITELKIAGKTARGSILLKDGKIVYCLLFLHDGVQITGERAYKQIEMCTEWQVELRQPEEKQKNSSSAQLSPSLAPAPFLAISADAESNFGPPPPLRQKRPLDPAFLQNLSLKERLILRSVYTMVNGTRSNQEIKAQLRFSTTDIDKALARLRMFDLIE
jgi:hypothetical protein